MIRQWLDLAMTAFARRSLPGGIAFEELFLIVLMLSRDCCADGRCCISLIVVLIASGFFFFSLRMA